VTLVRIMIETNTGNGGAPNETVGQLTSRNFFARFA
jgi:hypothetical protein